MGRILNRKFSRNHSAGGTNVSEIGIFVDFGSTYTKVAAMRKLLPDTATTEDVIDELETYIVAIAC